MYKSLEYTAMTLYTCMGYIQDHMFCKYSVDFGGDYGYNWERE